MEKFGGESEFAIIFAESACPGVCNEGITKLYPLKVEKYEPGCQVWYLIGKP